jgi:hypothetical protein
MPWTTHRLPLYRFRLLDITWKLFDGNWRPRPVEAVVLPDKEGDRESASARDGLIDNIVHQINSARGCIITLLYFCCTLTFELTTACHSFLLSSTTGGQLPTLQIIPLTHKAFCRKYYSKAVHTRSHWTWVPQILSPLIKCLALFYAFISYLICHQPRAACSLPRPNALPVQHGINTGIFPYKRHHVSTSTRDYNFATAFFFNHLIVYSSAVNSILGQASRRSSPGSCEQPARTQAFYTVRNSNTSDVYRDPGRPVFVFHSERPILEAFGMIF